MRRIRGDKFVPPNCPAPTLPSTERPSTTLRAAPRLGFAAVNSSKSRLVFEDVLAVPAQEGWVGTVAAVSGPDEAACLVDQAFGSVTVVHVSGDDDIEVVAEGDESAIEHPMRSPGQCYAIVDDVRSMMFDRSNVGRSDLSTTAPIDQLQPGYRTPLVVSS